MLPWRLPTIFLTAATPGCAGWASLNQKKANSLPLPISKKEMLTVTGQIKTLFEGQPYSVGVEIYCALHVFAHKCQVMKPAQPYVFFRHDETPLVNLSKINAIKSSPILGMNYTRGRCWYSLR
jgi:hypothetical protein